jgi:hypothetical protein
MKRCIALALLALFLCSGCVKTNYTALNAQKFTETVERQGAATDASAAGDVFSSDHPEALISRVFFSNTGKGWSGAFWEFSTDAAAAACYARLYEAYQPKFRTSPSDDYDRFETELVEGAQPVVKVVRVHGTVLLLSCADSDSSRDAASKLLVKLDYN